MGNNNMSEFSRQEWVKSQDKGKAKPHKIIRTKKLGSRKKALREYEEMQERKLLDEDNDF